jgi:hypothetical protein
VTYAVSGQKFIEKPGMKDPDIVISMVLAIMVVYLLIGLDLLDHMNTLATLREYIGLMWHNCMFIEGGLHVLMLLLQCLYSLMLAQYSFYVIM